MFTADPTPRPPPPQSRWWWAWHMYNCSHYMEISLIYVYFCVLFGFPQVYTHYLNVVNYAGVSVLRMILTMTLGYLNLYYHAKMQGVRDSTHFWMETFSFLHQASQSFNVKDKGGAQWCWGLNDREEFDQRIWKRPFTLWYVVVVLLILGNDCFKILYTECPSKCTVYSTPVLEF